MVIPATIYPESKNETNNRKNIQKPKRTPALSDTQKTNIKQTFKANMETNDNDNDNDITNNSVNNIDSNNDNLNNITAVGMEIIVNATSMPTTIESPIRFSYFFQTLSTKYNTNSTNTNNNKNKYRDINFELWTQQYGGAEGNLNAIHLDTYISGNGTFAKNVQLYPNKLWNLHQRTMRIGSLTYVPYVKTYYVVSFTKAEQEEQRPT